MSSPSTRIVRAGRRGQRGAALRGATALAVLAFVTASLGALAPVPASAQTAARSSAAAPPPHQERRSETASAIHHDTSRPLRDTAPAPFVPRGHHEDTRLPTPTPAGPDPVVQSSPPAAAAPVTSTNFNGVGNGFVGPAGTYNVSSAPPDTNGAVGPNRYFQIVNTSFAIFNKTGTALYGPATNNTLWSGFGGSCQTTNDGDPIVRYDQIADRWFVTQFANVASSTGPYYECVAVSTSGDPLGSYYRYSFSYANFPDYPKVGVWPDAYNITAAAEVADAVVWHYDVESDRIAVLTGQPTEWIAPRGSR